MTHSRIFCASERSDLPSSKRRGFAIAPILYLLMMIGVAAGMLFSSFSQVLHSNINTTNMLTAKNDINAIATALSASSGVSEGLVCTPPSSAAAATGACATATIRNLLVPLASADAAHLPKNKEALAGSGGNPPAEYGVLSADAGVKQLDPWGHYYIYCRWNTAVLNDMNKQVIKIITAGPSGTLQSTCDDGGNNANAVGDNQVISLTGNMIKQRASVWVNQGQNATYGTTDAQVLVTATGGMEAIKASVAGLVAQTATIGSFHGQNGHFDSLTLGTPLDIAYGGTGASDSLHARNNLGSGAIGDSLFVSTTATDARATLEAGAIGGSLFVAGTATEARSVLEAGAVGGSVFVAATTTSARDALGAGAIGHQLFTSTSQSGARSDLGAGTTGDSLFQASDPHAGRSVLGAGTVGEGVFQSMTYAAAWAALGLTGGSGTLQVNVTGQAGTVPATGIVGIVSISQGGTGASSAASARTNLGADNASNLTTGTLSVSRLADNSITSAKLTTTGVTAQTYNWGTVDAAGRVTEANDVVLGNLTDGSGDGIAASTSGGGSLTFMTASTVWMTLDSNGYLGLNVANPGERLHVNVGNIRVSGPAATARDLQFTTSTSSLRWVLGTDSTAESGSNAGSNFFLNRYSDAGGALGTVLAITRSTGAASFSGTVASTGGFNGNLTGNVTGQISLPDGTVGAPSMNFQNNANMGLYRPGASAMAFVTGGAERLRLSATAGIGIGTTAPRVALDIGSLTDAMVLPVGTTAQRPGSNFAGAVRYNTTIPSLEVNNGSGWSSLITSTSSMSSGVILGASAAATNPQRSGDATTGLFSAAAGTVSVASSSAEVARFSATGLNLPGLTTAYSIAGSKVAALPGSDTTSLALGPNALAAQNTTSLNNVAVGSQAATSLLSGHENVAVGVQALYTTTTGYQNVAVGTHALYTDSSGAQNLAAGYEALYKNTTGSDNVASGARALYSNQGGNNNATLGYEAMYYNSSGSENTAAGFMGMASNTTGNNNTALGAYALYNSATRTTGNNNTAIGYQVGSKTLVSGSGNILIGTSSLTDVPSATTNNWMNIGNTLYADLSAGNVGFGNATIHTGVSVDMGSRVDSLLLPTGTTGQRPGSGVQGMMRYNSSIGQLEAYTASGWATILSNTSTSTADVFLGSTAALTNPHRNGDATTGLFSPVAGTVAISTAGTEALRVSATGSVGIGTTAPSASLDVRGGAFISSANDGIVRIGSDSNGEIEIGNIGRSTSGQPYIDFHSSVNSPDYDVRLQASGGTTTSGMADFLILAQRVTVGSGAPTAGAGLDLSSRTGTAYSSMIVPKDTTANRPSAGVAGMLRYNTTLGMFEAYTASGWSTILANTATNSPDIYLGPGATQTNPHVSGDITTGLFSGAASTVGIATAGVERLRVTATGSVGIGTTAPLERLHVAYAGNTTALIDSMATSRISQVAFIRGSGNATYIGPTASNTMDFWSYETIPFRFAINNAEVMRITTTGSVGIGTTTPAYPLDVNGSARVTGNIFGIQNGYGIYSDTAYSTGAGIQVLGTTASTPNTLSFWTGAAALAERMRITATGSVGIGTASPLYMLDVAGGIRSSGEIISTSANQFRMVYGSYGAFWRNDGSNTYLLLTASGDQYGTWNTLRPFQVNNVTGNVTVGTNAYFGSNLGIGTATTSAGASLDMGSKTDSILMPKGTTAQRPATGLAGMARYNSSIGQLEAYTASGWVTILANTATSSPDVYLGSATSATNPHVNGDVTTGLFSPAASNVAIATAGTERLRVTATGSVGVGTTAPAYTFDVTGQGRFLSSVGVGGAPLGYSAFSVAGESTMNSQDGNGLFNIVAGGYQAVAGSTYVYTNTRGASRLLLADANIGLFAGGANGTGSAGTTISWTQLADMTGSDHIWLSPRGTSTDFYMTSTGGIGIGTATPLATLNIKSSYSCCGAAGSSGTSALAIDGAVNDLALRLYNSATGGRDWRLLSSGGGTGVGVGNFNIYDVSAGATRLSISATGYVGIGMTAPKAYLDIGTLYSCCATQTPTLGISENSTSNSRMPWIQFHAAGKAEAFLRLQTANRTLEIGDNQAVGAGLAIMKPDLSGRNVYLSSGDSSYILGTLGVGTSSPGVNFDLQSNNPYTAMRIGAASTPTIQFLSSWGGTDVKYWDMYANSFNFIFRAVSDDFMNNTTWLQVNRGGTYGYSVSSISFPSAAPVGIGTSSPTHKLHVYNPAGGARTGYHQGMGGVGDVYITDNNAILSSNVYYNGAWYNTAAGMGTIIDFSNGTLNIQTTASAAAGATPTTTSRLYMTNAGFLGLNAGVPTYPVQVGTTTSNGNGAFLDPAGVWTNASDARSKENVHEVPYGLETLMKLKPVAYEMKGTHQKQIGFIAQEVAKVVPEVTSVSDKGWYGLSYGNMTAITVKAIQEMKVENDRLAAEVARLKDQGQDVRAGRDGGRTDALTAEVAELHRTVTLLIWGLGELAIIALGGVGAAIFFAARRRRR